MLFTVQEGMVGSNYTRL